MQQGAVVSHHGMPLFHMSLRELVREAFGPYAAALGDANLAIREGKAVEQFRERVIGLTGVRRMEIEDPGRERTAGDVRIRLVAGSSLTPEEAFLIRCTRTEVNRRFGTQIRCAIVRESEQDIKEGPEYIKKS